MQVFGGVALAARFSASPVVPRARESWLDGRSTGDAIPIGPTLGTLAGILDGDEADAIGFDIREILDQTNRAVIENGSHAGEFHACVGRPRACFSPVFIRGCGDQVLTSRSSRPPMTPRFNGLSGRLRASTPVGLRPERMPGVDMPMARLPKTVS